MKTTIRLACLLIIGLLGAIVLLQPPAAAEVTGGPAKLNNIAPRFSLQDQSGRAVGLGQFSGKYVVIEFMSPDCLYVKRHYQAKTFQNLAEKFKDKNVVWVAIDSSRTSNQERHRKWATEFGVDYPILDDSNLDVAKAYAVTKTPHICIVDRNGKIAYVGAVDNDDSRDGSKREGLRNYIDRALGELTSGNPVSIPETTPYGCDLNKLE